MCTSSSARFPVFTSYSVPGNSTLLSHGVDSSSFPFFANVTSVSGYTDQFHLDNSVILGRTLHSALLGSLTGTPIADHIHILCLCTYSIINILYFILNFFWQNRLQEASSEMLLILVLKQAHDTGLMYASSSVVFNSLRPHGL